MLDYSFLFSVLSASDPEVADKGLFYVCLSFSILWVVAFGYLIRLDSRIRDVHKRLSVRESGAAD
jgi:CcmD family protein